LPFGSAELPLDPQAAIVSVEAAAASMSAIRRFGMPPFVERRG
jgi:hypothetical protein